MRRLALLLVLLALSLPTALAQDIVTYCPPYDPSSATNVCARAYLRDVTVWTPGVGIGYSHFCPGTPWCFVVPYVYPTSTSTDAPAPAAEGYVEATLLCPLVTPCRATLS